MNKQIFGTEQKNPEIDPNIYKNLYYIYPHKNLYKNTYTYENLHIFNPILNPW